MMKYIAQEIQKDCSSHCVIMHKEIQSNEAFLIVNYPKDEMSWDNDGQRLWTGKDFIEYVKLRWGNPLFRRNCCWYSTGSIVSCDTGKVLQSWVSCELLRSIVRLFRSLHCLKG